MLLELIDGHPVHLKKNTSYFQFDSPDEQAACAVESYEKYRHNHPRAITINDESWLGRSLPTWESIYRATSEVHEPDMKIVDTILEALRNADLPKPVEIKRRAKWDENAGEAVDIDRWRAGEDYWRAISPKSVHGPRIVTLMAQVGGHCLMSAESLLFRGAVAVALSQMLEDAGYRTEITAVFAGTQIWTDGTDMLSTTILKKAADPLDLVALTNLFAGWYFRTVQFATMYATGKPLNGNRGYPKDVGEAIAKYVSRGARPWLISEVYTLEAAIDYATEMINQLNQEATRCV